MGIGPLVTAFIVHTIMSYILIIKKILNFAEWKSACNAGSFIYVSFTLYSAHSRVGRGNLVVRHSVSHFLPNSGGIAC